MNEQHKLKLIVDAKKRLSAMQDLITRLELNEPINPDSAYYILEDIRTTAKQLRKTLLSEKKSDETIIRLDMTDKGTLGAKAKDQVEDIIQRDIDAGKTAPRLTEEHIKSRIKSEQFHVFEGSQLTVCCLTLLNGYTVTGESACVSPENFNAEIGRKIARDNAIDKIWTLEGYLLKEAIKPELLRGTLEKSSD